MKKFIFIHLILILLLALGCTKSPGKTAAKLKLDLSRIVDVSSGIGSGGAILFGRNHLGNIFGKKLIGNEENLDLPNGNWVFYALMWDSAGGATPMNGKVHCAKVAQQLSGTDTSISLNLDNANCADPEFSEGRFYTNPVNGHKRFADIYLEECDVANGASPFTCGLGNQGSGVAYRLKFQSFRKSPTSPFIFEGEPIVSDCRQVNAVPSIHSMGFPINFPSGGLATPFVVTVETFLSSTTCDPNDPKGVFQLTLNQGLKSQNPTDHKVLFSTTVSTASVSSPDFSGAVEDNKKKCEEGLLGVWGSGCSNIPLTVSRFAPTTVIASYTAATPAIKHLFQIPKPFLCGRYLNSSAFIGTHPFAGGDGSIVRPYKICTEWQINQIGEHNAPSIYKTNSFKLLNDLDMNKADFQGGYARPYCNTAAGIAAATSAISLVKDHHNLNSLDGITTNDCGVANSTPGFTGTFNGNGRTISNARIVGDSVNQMGLVRDLNGGAIFDLIFKNLEVRGNSEVGGIAGRISVGANTNIIKNVLIKKLEIEANNSGSYVGGIAGQGFGTSAQTILNNVHVKEARIRGSGWVGGLIGKNMGSLTFSSFIGNIHQDNGTGDKIGGIAGENAAGIISNSFSEGLINSSVMNVGGIVGDQTTGSLSAVYSTMVIVSNYMSASHVGGIVGQNAGSIADSYFSGSLINTGTGPDTNFGAIIGVGNGVTNSWSDRPVGTATTPGSSIGYADLRNLAFGTMTLTSAFTRVNSSLPRLAWEVRECLNPVNQGAFGSQTGVGSAVAPYIVCNLSQFVSLNTASAYYRLGDDLSLANGAFNTSSPITSFSGHFDGAGHALYGVNMTAAYNPVPTYNGIFGALTSTGGVKNLNLYGNIMFTGAQTLADGSGILVGQNDGTINNIAMAGNRIEGHINVGALVGKNNTSGQVLDVDVEYTNKIFGFQNVGGVVGYNVGALFQLESQAEMSAKTGVSNFEIFGGITGYNGGTINQARYGGRITMTIFSDAANGLRVGGLVGLNESSINNSYTDSYAEINVKNNNVVGGLIGENAASGSISTSFALGKLIYSSPSVLSVMPGTVTFNPIVGDNTAGGTISTSTFYLDKNMGSLLNQGAASGTCSGSALQTCMTSTYNVVDADLFGFTNQYGGQKLSSLISLSNAASTIDPIASSTTSTAVVNTAAAFMNGMVCYGNGISPNTTITSTNPGTSITLSSPVSLTQASFLLTCRDPMEYSFNLADNGNIAISSGTGINFYAGHTPLSTSGVRSIADFNQLSTFCSSWSADADADKYCTAGYNIVGVDSALTDYGHNRLMGYYGAMMNGLAVPANAPIWELDHEGYPQLLQLHR